jgi:predicted site-specific integrase-resolvase
VGVNRSRLANDMIQEIEKEREERKLVIQQKEDLQRNLNRLEEEYKQVIDILRIF